MHLCNGVCQLGGDVCREILPPLLRNGGQEGKYSPAVYFIIFYTSKHCCKTDECVNWYLMLQYLYLNQ